MPTHDPAVADDGFAEHSGRRTRRTRQTRRLGRRVRLAGAATAAGVALASTAGAGVASAGSTGGGYFGGGFGGPGGRGVVGTLTSVSGSTLKVKTTSGIETVTVSRSTTYDKTITGTIALLTNGNKVTATGSLSETSLNATRVAIGHVTGFAGFGGGNYPMGGYRGGAGGAMPGGTGGGQMPSGGSGVSSGASGGAGFTSVTGTVSDLTKTSFLLTEASGTHGTVNVSSSTVVTDTNKISEAKLTIGQTVTVRGAAGKKVNTFTATSVVEGKAVAFGFGFGGSRPGL